MSGDVSDRKRLISVTGGNLRNNHLYFSGHHDFFPRESYGKPRKQDGAGQHPPYEEQANGSGDRRQAAFEL